MLTITVIITPRSRCAKVQDRGDCTLGPSSCAALAQGGLHTMGAWGCSQISQCTREIRYRFAIAPCTQDSVLVPIAYTVGRAVDPRSQISDLRRDDSDLRSQVDCTSRQSPAREARRSKIWSGKVNVMSCRDICLDVKKPNVMSCRDICLKKFNMRHRHLPRINKHLRKGQVMSSSPA